MKTMDKTAVFIGYLCFSLTELCFSYLTATVASNNTDFPATAPAVSKGSLEPDFLLTDTVAFFHKYY